MAVSITEQGFVFLFACLVGVVLGIFYDVFRIARIAFNPRFFVIFIEDILFCFGASAAVVLFVYYANSGIIRWFALVGCALAFAFYYFTAGKLVMYLSEKIIRVIAAILRFIYNITFVPVRRFVIFIAKLIVRAFGKIIAAMKKGFGKLIFNRKKKNFVSQASKGFGVYK